MAMPARTAALLHPDVSPSGNRPVRPASDTAGAPVGSAFLREFTEPAGRIGPAGDPEEFAGGAAARAHRVLQVRGGLAGTTS